MQLVTRILTRRAFPPWALVFMFAVGAVVVAVSAVAGKLGTATGPSSSSAGATAPSGQVSARRRTRRPNVVVIMTDDQTAANVRFMPQVLRLIGRAGTQFS